MGQEDFEMLLNFFKLLGNESRLKIVGILANNECTVTDLATKLNLKEPTISQHLNMLKAAGFVDVRPDGNFRYYSFNPKALYGMSKDIFSREQLATLVKDVDETGNAFERKVLKTFIVNDQITQIPANEKKQLVILKWLAGKFEDGIQYPEKQVNEILKRHHPDYATLRRDLVDFKFMRREKGIYWKVTT